MPITFSVEAETSKTTLAEMIAKYEGFYKEGARAQRNNNPGNLRYVTWSTRKIGLDDANFAIYPSVEAGFADLHDFLLSKADQGYTLESLMHLYAPTGENNTSAYIDFLSSELGMKPNTKLSTILY